MSTTSITIFQIILVIAALFCTVVFGEMLVFQTVVMPGIAKLDDGAYLRAFQVIDGVIQDNEPVFVSVWIGSVIAILSSCIYGIALAAENEEAADAVLTEEQLMGLLIATLCWIVCQITTFRINVPLNNRVKGLDLSQMSKTEETIEREHFEETWMKWHFFRTVLFGLVSVYLMNLLVLVR